MIYLMKSKFEFSTKAKTLESLREIVKSAKVLPQISFTVGDWLDDSEKIIFNIKKYLKYKFLVVRSSALNEDTENESKAGNYESILNVNSENNDIISSAVEEVIKSYLKGGQKRELGNEILVQPMLGDVELCGVLFTRDIQTGAPYYTINYDTSGSTDSVTSGNSNDLHIFTFFKYSKNLPSDKNLKLLIELARELESLTSHEALDIEFAITPKGLFLLQARPIAAITGKDFKNLDFELIHKIDEIKSFISSSNDYFPNLSGKKTIYGIMPDWNPAEIIGVSPKPLAFSLYRELITNEIWPVSRAEMGYKEIGYHPGITSFSGKPYVDVRMSFNTFLTNNLGEELEHKLIDFYIDKLIKNPQLHDKVEFNIIHTCAKLNFGKEEKELLENNFNLEEINVLKNSLIKLTNSIICEENFSIDFELNKLKILEEKRNKIINSNVSNLVKVSQLIYDCKIYGTLPFSKLARIGFIGSILLKSLKEENIINNSEYDLFFNSIETVAGDFLVKLNDLKNGDINKNDFINGFGHLRPGTYDITSMSYKEAFDTYIDLENFNHHHDDLEKEFVLSSEILVKIDDILLKNGFEFNSNTLCEFIKSATSAREFAKFEFTKNLSLIFELLGTEFDVSAGISREDLAFLEINDILKFTHSSSPKNFFSNLKNIIAENKVNFLITESLKLPPVIYQEKNIDYFHTLDNQPNFVSNKLISSEVIVLDSHDIKNLDLTGKIILIENADPGFDWVFSHNIGGLITKFGGTASHMSIRCAEFNLPAAIGCGASIYEYVEKSKKIEMNCSTKQIKRIV